MTVCFELRARVLAVEGVLALRLRRAVGGVVVIHVEVGVVHGGGEACQSRRGVRGAVKNGVPGATAQQKAKKILLQAMPFSAGGVGGGRECGKACRA